MEVLELKFINENTVVVTTLDDEGLAVYTYIPIGK